MRRVVVVAPHPDDETLGCGGTLLKHRSRGDELHWVIVTSMTSEAGFSASRMNQRDLEIQEVATRFGFESVHQLGFPTTKLDAVPISDVVNRLGRVFKDLKPQILYIPHRDDVHTDHRVVFDSVVSCTKWFRFPGVERILVYETLSETEFGLNPGVQAFRPNVFVDVSEHISEKIEIMSLYRSEYGDFPFPRSGRAMRALAEVRGATIGCSAAEAFLLLKEVW